MPSFFRRMLATFQGEGPVTYGRVSEKDARDPRNNVAIYLHRVGGSPPYRGTTVHFLHHLMPAPEATVQEVVARLLQFEGIPEASLPYVEVYATRGGAAAPSLPNHCPFLEDDSDDSDTPALPPSGMEDGAAGGGAAGAGEDTAAAGAPEASASSSAPFDARTPLQRGEHRTASSSRGMHGAAAGGAAGGAASTSRQVLTESGSPALRLGALDATPMVTALATLGLTLNTARFSVVQRKSPEEKAAPMRMDIGVFVAATGVAPVGGALNELGALVTAERGNALAEPGAAWLLGPSLPASLPPSRAVAAVAAAAVALQRGSRSIVLLPPMPRLHAQEEIVAESARTALIALVDASWALYHGNGDCIQLTPLPVPLPRHTLARGIAAGSTRDDFKLLLAPAELRRAIGEGGAVALAAALGGPPHAIAVRRTTATGRWINFHADAAGATVQVPLSGDDACEGGRLVFAEACGVLRTPVRRPGVPLAHSGDEVHGVTRLVRGVRYGLFLLRARPTEEGSQKRKRV